MTLAPYFHVGILVPDLDAAMARFSEVLGLEFVEPANLHTEVEEADRTVIVDGQFTFSRQGPPYIELIQASGTGTHGLHNGIGLHHIGAWVDDAEEHIKQMAQAGVATEGVFRAEGHVIGAFYKPADLLGVRYEISPKAVMGNWEAWLHGAG
jgi:catechol 2,3-dioxygenase-like lactoylglutathione lyase family enzyme